MKRTLAIFLGVTLVVCHSVAEDAKKPTLPPATARTIDFDKDVRPIFARNCVSCHGPEKQRAGLRLDTAEYAMKGSNAGVVLKAGDVNSKLLRAVAGLEEHKMPPEGKTPLTAAEIGHLRAWIEQGAKWPKDSVIATGAIASKHWAFQPVRRPKVPAVKDANWARNDLDAFVLARLEKEGITPSPEADRVTLIRRLSLDLLGLPPTPDEVDAFLNDNRPDAYERLVDRLLASPHYGERWARHWLDMARYADSDGFEKDTGRPFAWRYRNWLIGALNRDLPFDKFTIDQLAGDLLPNATTEQKVATGFHRNTLTNKEGGVDQEQFRVEACVDRVNTTMKVFLGLTFGCAQCHDHKYDPFSQREYYQLFAFFNSDVEANIPAPLAGEQETYDRAKTAFEKKLAELQAAVANYTRDQLPAAQKSWEDGLKLTQLRALPVPVRDVLLLDPAKRTAAQKKTIADHFTTTDKKLIELNKAVAAHQKTAPAQPLAQTLALGPARKTHVMIRGDFLRPGVEVQAGVPGVLASANFPEKANRLDLAKWIVDPANPLSRRVLANWIWQRYFGRGLVPTLEDFGTQGEKPSHPELLDWLADEVLQKKLSLKRFHTLIVTSATYRQSSRHRPELANRDAINTLLARQARHRLDAEVIRDVSLAASGLLTRTIGGPSVRPPQPAGISELTYAGSAKWVESTGPDRYRRGMYIWFQRTSPYPMLMTFDAPDSNVCVVRRERSNTPLQALTLMNDTVFAECAQALGKRIMTEKPGTTEDRLRYAFRLCLGRTPSEKELAILARLYGQLLAQAKAKPEAAAKLVGTMKPAGVDVSEAATWVAIGRTLLNLDEFVTRE